MRKKGKEEGVEEKEKEYKVKAKKE